MLSALRMKERGLEEVVQDHTSGTLVCVIPLASNLTLITIEKQGIPVGFHNFLNRSDPIWLPSEYYLWALNALYADKCDAIK